MSVCNIHSEQWNSGKMTIYLFIVWTVYVKYFPSQKTVDLYTVFLVVTVAFFSHRLLNRFILLNIVAGIIKRAYNIKNFLSFFFSFLKQSVRCLYKKVFFAGILPSLKFLAERQNI